MQDKHYMDEADQAEGPGAGMSQVALDCDAAAGSADVGVDTVIAAALKYLHRGWSVIPLRPQSKLPLLDWKRFQAAHATPDEVRSWFSQHPNANIGIVTGKISGIVAVDEDGAEGRAALEARIGPVRTLTSESGRPGGRHHIFAHPGFATVTKAKILASVDVRGDGGYIVAPPSVHPNGNRYHWTSERECGYDAQLQPLPSSLHDLVRKPEPESTPRARTRRPRVTREEIESPVYEGERDNRLVRYAGSFVADGSTGQNLMGRLSEINARWFNPPLPERDVERIANSAEGMEQRKAPNRKVRTRAIVENLDAVSVEEMHWLWEGYIPLGVITVLDGYPGVGKGLLTADLAARVSTGREMPDGSGGVAGHVLLINCEDATAVTLKPRVLAAGGDDRRITAMKEVCANGINRLLRIPDDIEAIADVVRARGTKLIVIDPIIGFLAGHVNSYSDQHVRSALAPLAKLAEEYDLAVILVRHPTKNRERSAIEAGGGSIGIIAAARAGFYVAKSPAVEGEVVLAFTKINGAPDPRSMAFRIETSSKWCARIVWQGFSDLSAQDLRPQVSPKATRVGTATSFLQDFLCDGTRAERDIVAAAEAEGISHSTLKRAKRALAIDARKVSFDGGWSWSLPTTDGDPADMNAARLVAPAEGGVMYEVGAGGTTETKEPNPLLRPFAPDGTGPGDNRREA